MSTQNYYKEKLGFDPKEGSYYDAPPEKYRKTDEKPHGYEENLTKFKGTIWDLFIESLEDERDAVQKKTFTKWVNKHLKKVRNTKPIVILLLITFCKRHVIRLPYMYTYQSICYV
uniref:Plectin-like isoform X1 n=1 Tax=Diabrotica virgifera virgifera TaxID=50390 RepID=A0A6P7GIS4_DIAVI